MFRKTIFLLIAVVVVWGVIFIRPRFQVAPNAQPETVAIDSKVIQTLRRENVELFYTWHANYVGGRSLL